MRNLVLLSSILLSVSCRDGGLAPQVAFREVGEGAGFRFRHELPGGRLDNLPKAAMGGLAVLDYDGDGRLDVYLVNGGWHDSLANAPRPGSVARNRLLRNLGGMRFEDVTEAAGVGDQGFGMGVCVGDVDNDGRPDLLVLNYGAPALYVNRGDGTFEERAAAAGLRPGFLAGAAFGDFDADGLLDLFVSQYVDPDGIEGGEIPDRNTQVLPPRAYSPQPAMLYRNRGDGTFEDVTAKSGLARPGKGMGALATDFDRDGRIDLLVANDGMPNFAWRNDGDGTFTERGAAMNLAFGLNGAARASMGVTAADMDGDGLLDYLVPDTQGGCIYVAQKTWFTDRAADWGLAEQARGFVGWADVAFDVDNDGRMDIYKTHGDLQSLDPQVCRLVLNRGGGRFTAMSEEDPSTMAGAARGAVAADLDDDGLDDLIVLTLEGKARLFHNVSTGTGNWVRLRLVGARSNRMAIGARVTGRAGERAVVGEVSGSTGYISAGDTRLSFGLGAADQLTDVEIHWPSGQVQRAGPFEAGRVHEVTEPR